MQYCLSIVETLVCTDRHYLTLEVLWALTLYCRNRRKTEGLGLMSHGGRCGLSSSGRSVVFYLLSRTSLDFGRVCALFILVIINASALNTNTSQLQLVAVLVEGHLQHLFYFKENTACRKDDSQICQSQ